MRGLCRAMALAAALLAAGCIDFSPSAGEPPQLYTLRPASDFAAGPARTSQLVVDTPAAPDGLNTARIAVRESAQAIAYYAGGRWIDPAPRLIQTALLESFRNSGRLAAVFQRDVDLRGDYLLKLDLRDFSADASGAGGPSVTVAIAAHLIAGAERRIVASRNFERSENAESARLGEVVAAFERATQRVLAEIVDWTLERLD